MFFRKNRWMCVCVCIFACWYVYVCVCAVPLLYLRVPSSLSPHPLPLFPARGPKPFPFYILYPVLSIVDPPLYSLHLIPSLPPPVKNSLPMEISIFPFGIRLGRERKGKEKRRERDRECDCKNKFVQ